MRAGAQVPVTVRANPKVRAATAAIPDSAWSAIEYPQAIFDEDTGRWISRAEVAEVPFAAFTSRKKAEQVSGRLVVRRVPDLNPAGDPCQATLSGLWRFHAFVTTSDLDTATADKIHRQHAIIEQANADLKNSALAHLPSAGSPPTVPGWPAQSWRSTSAVLPPPSPAAISPKPPLPRSGAPWSPSPPGSPLPPGA